MKLKWIFAALVLANLGLWMWASWYKEPAAEGGRVEARPSIAPEKMRLLTEAGVKLQPRKAPPAKNDQLTNLAPVCLRLGPFSDPPLAAAAEIKIIEMKLAFSRRSEEARVVLGYRVYLPPLPSKEAAERKRRELTRLGFKDHALIQEEGWHNAISLGLFSVEANAQSRVRELAAKKIETKTEPLVQTQTFIWLDITAPVPAETAARMKQTDWGAKDIHAQEIACPANAIPPSPPREPLDNAPM